MNILVVDDNANNRMILKLLLEDYEEENADTRFFIEEAGDGQEALKKCEESHFDIVLMDIMMPNMNGIEATKVLREKCRDIMIIAVSAVDDSERQRKILNNGAEDYISKPVNADIFASRISNYITIVEARRHKYGAIVPSTPTVISKINLFKKSTFSRYTTFVIDSEDSLSEFWEHFLLNAKAKYDNLSDVVRAVFAIADYQVRLSIDSEIYIEESEKFQYFTLSKIDKLPPKIVDLSLKRNHPECPYLIEPDKISFELPKIFTIDEEDELEVIEINKSQEPLQEVAQTEQFLEPIEASKELQVFDYIDTDDLLDLEEFASKLSSLMLIVGSGDITEEEFEEMCSYLEKLGSILSTYSEVYPISKALLHLSQDLETHKDEFFQNSEALGPMCKAFSNDMSTWIQQSFHTGAPSAEFMNDTIVVNCETIANMLKMNDTTGDDSFEELDDIFDF